MDAVSSDKAVTRSKEKVLKQQKLFAKVQEKFVSRLDNESYKEMKAKRSDLPISAYREDIIDVVKNNQFLIISGETGW
jgi:ATP-dependent RNA helicase DHX29